MIEFYKRCWQVFLPLFAVFSLGSLQAFYYLNEYSHQWAVIVSLVIVAIICLIIGLIGFINTLKDAQKKERKAKVAKNHEALKEAFKRLHPEWTDEQLEIAATGSPAGPPLDDEDHWMSPREAYDKSCRKKK